LFEVLKIYKAKNEDKDFFFMRCFKKLEGCKKWDDIWQTLNDGKTVGDGEGPLLSSMASTVA
jgi:hypothetical protein